MGVYRGSTAEADNATDQVINQKDNIYAHALNRRYNKGASRKMSKEVQEQENTTVAEQREACEQRQIEGAKRQVRDHIILAVLLKRGPQTVEALSKNAHINSRSIQPRCCAWTDTVTLRGTSPWSLCWTCLRFSLNTPTTPTALRSAKATWWLAFFSVMRLTSLIWRMAPFWVPEIPSQASLRPRLSMHGAR